MEEIDIIELLKRVKEGNAPKEIQVGNFIYSWHTEVEGYFRSVIDNNYISVTADFDIFNILDTKIKILDKPIIEELSKDDMLYGYIMGNKINEIIKWINNKE